MSNRIQINTKIPPPQRKRNRTIQLFVLTALVAIFTAILVLFRSAWLSEGPAQVAKAEPKEDVTEQRSETLIPPSEPEAAENADASGLIDDDGKTLWVSPTDGPAIDLGWLPPGCQVFVHMRPSKLLENNEGEKVLAALGPSGEWAVDVIEQAAGRQFQTIDSLLIGLTADATGNWNASYVVWPKDEAAIRQIQSAGKQTVFSVDTPIGKAIVVSPAKTLADIKDLAGTAPPLRREMEDLLAATDRKRQFTMVLAPNFLLADGKSLFTGAAQRLEDGIKNFFGEGLTAVAVSIDRGENFFLEMRAASTIDTKPRELSQQLAKRISELPAIVEEFIFRLDVQPYGRRLLARLPAMLRAIGRNSRTETEGRHAVVRCYLPPAAGHNLLMAGELALREPLRQSSLSSAAQSGAAKPIRDPLDKIISLSFARDTLEAALQILSAETGVEIELAGPDLQLEGITKNQSFALDQQNKPAKEILLKILLLANPDKSATSPADEKQKLVYLRRSSAGVLVTTRAAAKRRDERLAEPFLTGK